ncbi:hypothetical protein Tco_0248283 [Tanacetum coccineum]
MLPLAWGTKESSYGCVATKQSEACHLDEQNPKCLEDWENLDFQDLVVDDEGWVDVNGSNPGGGFGEPRGGRETRGGERDFFLGGGEGVLPFGCSSLEDVRLT